jgi:hypothetical protein
MDWDGEDFRQVCKIDQELKDAGERGDRGAGEVCGGTGVKKLKATEDYLGATHSRRAKPSI